MTSPIARKKMVDARIYEMVTMSITLLLFLILCVIGGVLSGYGAVIIAIAVAIIGWLAGLSFLGWLSILFAIFSGIIVYLSIKITRFTVKYVIIPFWINSINPAWQRLVRLCPSWVWSPLVGIIGCILTAMYFTLNKGNQKYNSVIVVIFVFCMWYTMAAIGWYLDRKSRKKREEFWASLDQNGQIHQDSEDQQ